MIGALIPPPGETIVGPGDVGGDCNGSALGDGVIPPGACKDGGACNVGAATPPPARDCAGRVACKGSGKGEQRNKAKRAQVQTPHDRVFVRNRGEFKPCRIALVHRRDRPYSNSESTRKMHA